MRLAGLLLDGDPFHSPRVEGVKHQACLEAAAQMQEHRCRTGSPYLAVDALSLGAVEATDPAPAGRRGIPCARRQVRRMQHVCVHVLPASF